MAHGRKTPFSSLTRTAGEVKRYRTYQRIIPAAMGGVAALLVIVYVISVLFSHYGSFTVVVENSADKRKFALSLAESDNFANPTSRLNSRAVKDITNIDGNMLPSGLNDEDGEHNGEDYVAYTFDVKNVGEEVCDYRYKLAISKMTAGIDAAVRLRLYFNPLYYDAQTGEYRYSGDYVDYAKPKSGGNGAPEVDPPGRVMTNFLSGNTVTEGLIENFVPGSISRVTVVIWLEGNDPECTDDILGGEFKMDMSFEIVDDTVE